MQWPPPKNLRPVDDLTAATRHVARLRLPFDRYAFVAIFEVLARRDQGLANRIARELAEAEHAYRHMVYSSTRSREEALRGRLRTIRRLDRGRGKSGAVHQWDVIKAAGRRIEKMIVPWLATERTYKSRLALADGIAEKLNGCKLGRTVMPADVGRVLASGRKADAMTAQVLAFAVYGRTGTPHHIIDGVKGVSDLWGVDGASVFQAPSRAVPMP